MKTTFSFLLLAATSVSAQVTPVAPARPARVTVPAERPDTPRPDRAPRPLLPLAIDPLLAPSAPAMDIEWMIDHITPPPAPVAPAMPVEWLVAPEAPMPARKAEPVMPLEWLMTPPAAPAPMAAPLPQGTPARPTPAPRPLIDRFELERLSDEARLQAELARDMAREQSRFDREQVMEQARIQSEMAREMAMQQRQNSLEQVRIQQDLIREQAQQVRQHAAEIASSVHFDYSFSHNERVTPPAPWRTQDVGDSLYRFARDLFNRGEWGQAASAFRNLPQRFPNSTYASEAGYYEAYSLYRIGGTPDLRAAVAALEAQRSKYPNARSRTEATNLNTRILGVLASRGDAQAKAQLDAIAAGQGATCDKEEQTVQAEAMNALSRSDAANVNELITRVLARRDECSAPLRRTAVFLVGNRRDAQAVSILAGVARNDPSNSVRMEAVNVLGRLPSDEGAGVLEEIARGAEDDVQRAAVRALVRHPSSRARTYIRQLVERDDVSERVRSEALSAFNAERATAEDIVWLRALYARLQSPTLKSRALSAITRVGGADVDQWLVTIASNENERSELRATAMRRIGTTMSIADLGRLYDQATQQRFRREVISVLGKRKEDAATDKLIDIVKNGTDPALRTSAISALTDKNDPRATTLLLEIINK